MPWIAGCRLLHRDPWVLIVEKPSGLLSQPGLGPAQADSLLSRLQHHEPTLALVHRLDRDTSGLLMLARTSDALSAFSRLFASRRVRKLYVADVCGAPPGSSGCVDLPLARLQTHPPRYGWHPDGRSSQTRWRVQSGRRLWLQPITGRSHQLRAHLAALGCAIQGDPIYAGHDQAESGRMHLHATALSLLHPFTGQRLRCRSAVPFLPPEPLSARPDQAG